MHASEEQADELAFMSLQSQVHGHVRVAVSGPIIVGRALSADVVLSDPSLAMAHFQIEMDGDAVLVTALEGSVSLDGDWVIGPGESKRLQSSARLDAVTLPIWIELREHQEILVPKPRRPMLWLMAASLLILSSFGSAAYSVAGRAPSARAVAPVLDVPAKIGYDADTARVALAAELDSRGLRSVRIDTLPEGSNRASGTIAPDEVASWRDAKRWADASLGSVLLIDNVAVAAKGPLLAIQSAWIGENSYLIDGAGEKLFVGAVLSAGWTIEAIEAGQVRLKRQGQKLAIRF